ncbi:LSU ribosomal protein L9P [Desulfonispora thiosulfatigenes DSM 11270]|uniref:Large ribosomal subunit protein bL9 n=1 Tax=Desulfonispora thiosulfatigenes DSM 11270 TaxID=656914 RepID=A0A1W1V3T6_DESTI|nr:50S ribosomal protein L9 [Desulfonispora thiosulfatigenes]SMB87714.1 LSU ribosomal protein L9P [Desulfonispora thiosulfatigenes DSM 11270]
MKVILQADVKALGKKGEVIEAKEGYARNYLLPKGLAVEATTQNLKEVERLKKLKDQKEEKELAEANELAEKISNIKVVLKVKSGEGGRLFGAVTSKEIAEDILKNHNIKIDKRKIELKDNIKTLGTYNIKIKVHTKVTADLSVQVIAE